MRLAVISDLHLGNPKSYMVRRDQDTGEIVPGDYFEEFKSALKNKFNGKSVDYLILLGDILDFSVTQYREAYDIGRFFFQKIRDEKLADEIIYIPGNHDFDIWNTIQYQLNITNRVIRGKSPKSYRMSVPVILDDRKSPSFWKLTLPKVRIHRQKGSPKYAGLFLDYLTNPPTPFIVGFPNLYLVTDSETIIMTHGHYMDLIWTFLGKWGMSVFGKDLNIKKPGIFDLGELVAMNLPVCELESAAVGQSGPLTDIIQKIQSEISEHKYGSVNKYAAELKKEMNSAWKGLHKSTNRMLFNIIMKKIVNSLEKVSPARYNIEFLTNPVVRQRFLDFYRSTLYEIEELKNNDNIEIPDPVGMIFGHTHQPIPWGSVYAPEINLPELPSGKKFGIYNTGGWLPKTDEQGKEIFFGAEVFFYDSKEGFSSTGIGYTE
ncbi:metallophosphoesterase [bacterium]|nr:metallophosphoesterase [bacterium]